MVWAMLRLPSFAWELICSFSFFSSASVSYTHLLTSLPYYQGSAMHALYQANEALGTVIDKLYAKMQEQAADPMKMGAVSYTHL